MQLIVNILEKITIYDLDSSLTINDLKNVINENEFIPSDIIYLTANNRLLTTGTLEDNQLTNGSNITLNLKLLGGTRYKKSSSQMRWKWKKKRVKRLQRNRRRMRNRAK
jgi:hypothetical protein